MGKFQGLIWYLVSGLLLIGLFTTDAWLFPILRSRQQKDNLQPALDATQNLVQPEDETPSALIARSLVLFAPSGLRLTPEEKQLLAERQAGGILLLAKNIADAQQTKLLVDEVLATATVSGSQPLVAVDQEGGSVSRLPWVEMTAQREIETEVEALKVSQTRGEQLRQLGIRMNFAPVVEIARDLCQGPTLGNCQRRTFIENRVFASESGKLAAAMVKGYLDAGIIPVAKHFPGGLGRGVEDPHQTLPVVDFAQDSPKQSRDRASANGSDLLKLLEEDLEPFRGVIAAQVPAIMVTHILYPEIDEMPASASRIFMNNLLRNQLGFTGVVVVDDLSMKAVTRTYDVGEYAVKSVNAGADLLLVSDFSDYETVSAALTQAIERGELKRDRLVEAHTRIEKLLETSRPAF